MTIVRTIAVSLLVCMFTVLSHGQEILRPSLDYDGLGVGQAGTCVHNNWSMPYAYDAAGESTSSPIVFVGDPGSYDWDNNVPLPGFERCIVREFSGFPSATQVYSSLVLKVVSSCQISPFPSTTEGGRCNILLSLDDGATWQFPVHAMSPSVGWNQETDTIALPANQDLTRIRVDAQLIAEGGDGLDADGDPVGLAAGRISMAFWDIRTEGQ